MLQALGGATVVLGVSALEFTLDDFRVDGQRRDGIDVLG